MKNVVYLLFLALITSCQSVRVSADYDSKVDFTPYKTYAFYKSGIDKVEISDLDKRRILNAIDSQMTSKGFTKSETPDLLINFFTKATERIHVNHFSYGWGWGWNPWFYGGPSYTTTGSTIEGTLYIDIIDAKNQELIWQGIGEGALTQNPEYKEARINEFVAKILTKYPPIKTVKP